MLRKTTALSALAALLLTTTAAMAEDYLTGYAGWFDLVDGEDEAAQIGLEYRFSPWAYNIHPMVGANVSTDGSVYGYGGFNWEIALLPQKLYLIPNLAVGGYSQGDGKDLGHGIEFRSGIELAYQLPGRDRIGVAFNHISNASLGDKNPGAETLLINYSAPVGNMLR